MLLLDLQQFQGKGKQIKQGEYMTYSARLTGDLHYLCIMYQKGVTGLAAASTSTYRDTLQLMLSEIRKRECMRTIYAKRCATQPHWVRPRGASILSQT